MPLTDYFSSDYATARGRFLEAADELGAEATEYAFDATGPNGEPLTMDAVRFGPADPSRLVIVSSGLHGVEGFFGSAVQLAWLKERGLRGSPASPTSLLMLHALNPYGFAWRRRWNENNVDLNRNFLDRDCHSIPDAGDAASGGAYRQLDPLLNPPSPPSRLEPYAVKAAFRILAAGYAARKRMLARGARVPPASSIGSIAQLGLMELQKTLPVGQRAYPKGLFYAGNGPEQTVQIVRDTLPQWIGSAREIVHLDVHTGLGRYGDCRLLLIDEAGSERAEWVEQAFGADSVVPRGDQSVYRARGQMTEDLRTRLPDRDYYGVTAEFGTYSSLRVLRALRAENRAHHYAPPDSAIYRLAKDQLVEAFCPAHARWRNACVDAGLSLIDRALESRGRGE